MQLLDLSNNKLTSLPREISSLNGLRTLILDSNNLSKLPIDLKHCESLKTLSVRNNQLASLNKSLSELTNLESLDVFNNKLRAIPDDLVKLTKVRIHANRNPIETYPKGVDLLYGNISLDLDERTRVWFEDHAEWGEYLIT